MGFSAMEPASLAVIRFTRVGPDGGTVFIQNPRWSDAQFIIHTFDVILNGNIVSLEAVAPVANFTANVTEGNAPLTVRFTDKSAGNVTAWSWAFGDGNISTEQHPVHTYWAPGNYIVNLTVMNNAGSNTMTRPGYISATVRGDFNKDGEVDISDVSKVAYMVVGKVAADSDADFNGNGKVDIGDAAKIAYFSVGKIEAL
ncbi:MAG: PKD domain-containing protein [Methanoculleus sp.]|nr:PKD domain-containing protein [Methanoculleus sp.]